MTRMYSTTARQTLVLALATLALLFAFLAPQQAEAGRSVMSSVNNIPELYQYANHPPTYNTDTVPLNTNPPCGMFCGWSENLDWGSNASIDYKARLRYLDGTPMLDGATLPVGTVFKVSRDLSTEATDISWNGTGFANDSPYGRWVANAGPLPIACKLEDKVGGRGVVPNFGSATMYDVYTLLNVAPPTLTVSNSAGISCVAVGANVTTRTYDCTVNSAGVQTVSMNFALTKGRFYFRWTGWSNRSGTGCHANNAPMREQLWDINGFPIGEPTLYEASFPAKTITFNLTGVATNDRPEAPSIIPQPATAFTGVPITFTFQASDPNVGDTIRYEIDWNNDGSGDQSVPAAPTYVPSDTSQSASYSWPTAGVKSFQARTIDNRGGISDWTPAQATITVPPRPTVTTNLATAITTTSMTLNGTVNPNSSATTGWFRYSSTNPGSCNDSFGTQVPPAGGTNLGSGSSNVLYSQPIAGLTPGATYYYCAIASNSGGIAFGTVRSSTTQSPDLAPIVDIAPPANVTVGESITFTAHARNNGSGSTGVGFSTNMTYQWNGTTGAWLDFAPAQTFPHGALGAGLDATVDTYTFSTMTTGTLYLQYCVDSAGVIPEPGGEGNNCYVTTGIVVADLPPQCGDGVDNADPEDLLADNNDPGCNSGPGNTYDPNDTDETDPGCPAVLDINGRNCDVPATPSGSSAGTCSPGYDNTCSYTCNLGTWSETENSCSPTPIAIDFKVCKLGDLGSCATTIDVNPSAPLELRWSAPSAEACDPFSGPIPNDFSTGGSNSGIDNTVTATSSEGRTVYYQIACSLGTAPPVIESVTINTNGGPTLTASRPIVDISDPLVRLTWDTDTVEETSCTLTGGQIGANPLLTDGGDLYTGSVDVNVTAQTTFTLTCPTFTPDTVTVRVISQGYEI